MQFMVCQIETYIFLAFMFYMEESKIVISAYATIVLSSESVGFSTDWNQEWHCTHFYWNNK